MSSDRSRGAKTQTLSLRLDPKTRFILDFMARIKGQSITTVVERAIKDAGNGTVIGPEYDERGNQIDRDNWSDFWDPSEGIRALKLLACPYYPTTYDDDELQAFTTAHQQFFYSDTKCRQPRRAYVEVLWENMERYLNIWREKKSEDYWAAGEAMAADLSAARVAPPDWPPKPKSGDLDDEIPF